MIASAFVIGAALVVAFAYEESVSRAEAVDDARQRLQATTDLLAKDMQRTLESAQKTLEAVAQIERNAKAEERAPLFGHKSLKELHASSPFFLSLIWTNRNGDRIASSFFSDPPPLNISRLEHFRLIADRGAAAPDLFLGSPIESAVLRSWIIPVTLAMHDERGEFAGVAGGTINPAYFSDLYALTQLGESGVVQLVRGDGVLLAQSPLRLEALGGDAEFDALAKDRSIDPGRIAVRSPVQNRELAIVASMSVDAALFRHWAQVREQGVILAILLGLLAAGAVAVIRTARKREDFEHGVAVREVEARQYAEAASDWFWQLDENLRFTRVSQRVEASLGIERERFYGKRMQDMLQADGNKQPMEALEAAIGDGRSFRALEFRNVGIGRNQTILVSGVPIHDEAGALAGYRGSATDVTALRTAEQRFRDAVESFPGRVMVFDKDERLILFNEGLNSPINAVQDKLYAGDTFEQMLRKVVGAGLIEDAKAGPEAWIANRVARFRAKSDTSVQRMQDKYIQVIERPMADGGTISLRIDVTEREQAVAAAHEALMAAERASQAKSDFLANMSHEFRTPLNAIIGFGQMLMLDKPRSLTHEQKEYVEHIERSGQHLLNLVSEVLDLAATEAGRIRLSLERVAVTPLIEQVVATMKPVAEQADVRLMIQGELEIPHVRADVQRARQVLLNLLSNAIKYNKPGGQVVVEAAANNTRVCISVIDDGIGITTTEQDQVFKPFNRLGAETSAIDGAGIGLALSKQLVEAMDGEIGFSSRAGVGSTFWVELPIDTASADAQPTGIGEDQTTEAASGYTMLYVEDNPSNLSLMEHLVSTLPDVTLHSAPTGPIGLELARARPPDIIVLDINLPGMNGIDVLRRLKSYPETSFIPVIALSAAASPRDIERGLAEGFFRYVTKPLDVGRFIEAVETALKSRHVTERENEEAERERDSGNGRAG